MRPRKSSAFFWVSLIAMSCVGGVVKLRDLWDIDGHLKTPRAYPPSLLSYLVHSVSCRNILKTLRFFWFLRKLVIFDSTCIALNCLSLSVYGGCGSSSRGAVHHWVRRKIDEGWTDRSLVSAHVWSCKVRSSLEESARLGRCLLEGIMWPTGSLDESGRIESYRDAENKMVCLERSQDAGQGWPRYPIRTPRGSRQFWIKLKVEERTVESKVDLHFTYPSNATGGDQHSLPYTNQQLPMADSMYIRIIRLLSCLFGLIQNNGGVHSEKTKQVSMSWQWTGLGLPPPTPSKRTSGRGRC